MSHSIFAVNYLAQRLARRRRHSIRFASVAYAAPVIAGHRRRILEVLEAFGGALSYQIVPFVRVSTREQCRLSHACAKVEFQGGSEILMCCLFESVLNLPR